MLEARLPVLLFVETRGGGSLLPLGLELPSPLGIAEEDTEEAEALRGTTWLAQENSDFELLLLLLLLLLLVRPLSLDEEDGTS